MSELNLNDIRLLDFFLTLLSELRSPWQQEVGVLPRRYEHARGGHLRDGAATHAHQAASGLQTLVYQDKYKNCVR